MILTPNMSQLREKKKADLILLAIEDPRLNLDPERKMCHGYGVRYWCQDIDIKVGCWCCDIVTPSPTLMDTRHSVGRLRFIGTLVVHWNAASIHLY